LIDRSTLAVHHPRHTNKLVLVCIHHRINQREGENKQTEI
jgi:hypothetical protein